MIPIGNFKRIVFFPLLLFLLIAILSSGCGTFAEKIEKLGPVELIKEGKNRLRDKKFNNAEQAFKKFTEKYPNNKLMAIATMGLADALYMDEKYVEADYQYLNFIELYPVHPNVDRAYFYKGMCSQKQMEVYNRDQSNTLEAQKSFEIVITEYPNSKYYKKAVKHFKECKGHLAKNLFYIGKYYYNVRAHQSAILRMTELIETYPGFKSNDEASFLIAESYFKEESYEKAAKGYRTFLEKYQKSRFRLKAYQRLKRLKKFE